MAKSRSFSVSANSRSIASSCALISGVTTRSIAACFSAVRLAHWVRVWARWFSLSIMASLMACRSYAPRDCRLREVKRGLFAEMFDIPCHEMGQLPRLPNVNPVIDGTEEAVALSLKSTARGSDEREDHHGRIVDRIAQGGHELNVCCGYRVHIFEQRSEGIDILVSGVDQNGIPLDIDLVVLDLRIRVHALCDHPAFLVGNGLGRNTA